LAFCYYETPRTMPKVIVRGRKELAQIKEACVVAATVLEHMAQQVRPGVTTHELDIFAKDKMSELGAESACYQYRNGSKVFPSYTCISINSEVVHGVASSRRTISEGDIVSLDVVVRYNGYIGDNARTIMVEPVSDDARYLVESTRDALAIGIAQAKPGNRVGNISNAIQQFIESKNLSIVRNFVGHGVGKDMHEEPQIPNYGRKTDGPRLRAGMTVAIEPMVNFGRHEVDVLPDGWTAVARDGSLSAHFEHTVLITNTKPEILTFCKI
jgi:methionyl aminopeptidase